MRIARCVVCGSEEGHDDTVAAQALGLHAPFGVRRCAECDMRWQSPRPTTAQLAALYASEYFDDPSTLDGELARYAGAPEGTRRYDAANRSIVVQQQRRHLDELRRHFPGGGRLLEVGCGRGGFLHRARADGWAVQGIEPSRSAAEAARAEGLDVVTAALEDHTPERPVDVVYSCHVLEHFADPGAAVRRMAGWLADGGAIYLEVPNQFEALTERLVNQARQLIRRPRTSSVYSVHHLSFFGPSQLERLFDEAGLDAEIRGWSPLPDRGWRRGLARLDQLAGTVARQASNLQVVARRR